MSIPIQNIYYLLCYAWEKLDEGKKIKVDESDYSNSIELFAQVLINGCNHLLARGLERNYVNSSQEYLGIKGKIDFKASINKNLFKQGRSICEFDEFDQNVLQNQIIKSTLKRLNNIQSLEVKIRREIRVCHLKFADVDEIELEQSLFYKVRIHRNNSFYDFLLRICKLIFENTVLDESNGSFLFVDFVRDEKAMAGLFEGFIRNFYKKEQIEFRVYKEDIEWAAIGLEGSSKDYLPKMQTDISLESKNRKIIIETKFYKNALNSRFETDKFISSNLYQLFSYLKNIEGKNGGLLNINCEGILLYPSVNYSLNESYFIANHKVSVKTVDLNCNWKKIENRLFEIIL